MADRALTGAWPAPAKLNLFLHVVGRRDDGYHDLQTVFQFIDLCDRLYFVPRGDGRIERRAGSFRVPPEDDLIVKAARLLQAESGSGAGVDIDVHKRIPTGGGLGGGSSDAATTLVALNRLWRLDLETSELAGLAARLGADVPIFVFGRSAWAEGTGERLTEVEPPTPWYLVIKPDCEVSTAEVFQAAELTRNTPPIKIADFLSGERRADLRNDCEAVVRTRYPEVDRALDWLRRRAPARLTGTGSCLFAPFENQQEAQDMLAEMSAAWTGFVVRGLNRSPLLERLAEGS